MAKDNVNKPFYKKWWFWLIVIIVIIAFASGGGDEEDTATKETNENTAANETKEETPKEEAKEEPKEEAKEDEVTAVKVGEKATIADVSFTVNGVEETNEIKSGNEFIENAKTEGKFIIADVTIENAQKEALTINSSFFKILKDDGTEYEAVTDAEVTMAMGDAGTDFFLEQINPGLSKSGKVVFEVPGDLDLTKAVLQCQTGFWGTETIEIKLK
ncbi:DUF4352 domain-containing protein [Metabacillus malikii]|uniref:DUF4352 domain-containing protein n=1 Tax=Metabacillus malikii TaxID=1504265 RepID=A0ABT9ZIH8_9BACI|nr:DUF4352 domain-containing protein [Metabacillus malikii]MDQ0232091.1 hypothetical protein [Metabacillus malikii]